MTRRRARAGTAALEFAFAAPVLLMLICTMIEGIWQVMTAAVLDIGVRQASRIGALGNAPSAAPGKVAPTREQAVREVVLHYGGGVIDSARLHIRLVAYAGPQQLRSGTGGVRDSAGTASAMVVYQVDYEQPLLVATALRLRPWGRDSLTHSASTVVRNEPF